MKDTENPFCLHRFASFSSTVADTIRFAHKIPPVHGYDRYQSLNMKMRPEMWSGRGLGKLRITLQSITGGTVMLAWAQLAPPR